MNDGILKKIAKACVLGGVGIALGGVITALACSFSTLSVRENKNEILNDYALTQEFKDEVAKRIDLYDEALEKGIFSRKEYDDKIKELSSYNFIETVIDASENDEYIKKIDNLNKNKSKLETIILSQIPVLAAGAVITGISESALNKIRKKENQAKAEKQNEEIIENAE